MRPEWAAVTLVAA